MLISFNSKIIEGSWGGGNQFVIYFAEYLKRNGYKVVFTLDFPKIDLIFMIHPDKNLSSVSYGIEEVKDYLKYNPNTILLHRINTSDERKGSSNENKIVIEANLYADYTFFISSYLRDLYFSKGFNLARPNSVILNGADEAIFNPIGRTKYEIGEKLKIITHHWSNNYMKGFDIYERLDLLIGEEPFKNLFEFTIVGNIPIGVKFYNTTVIKPLSGKKLAQVLKEHHIYVTATRNEPAGMHHVEGMRCGLPVLFLNSGALPEYCSPFGIEFTLINFEQKLLQMHEQYLYFRNKVLDCPYSGEVMSKEYEQIIKNLIDNKKSNAILGPNLIAKFKYMVIRNKRKIRGFLANIKNKLL